MATALERVRRLASPPAAGPGHALVLACLVVAVPVFVEFLALTTPLLSVAGMPNCPLP